MHQLRILSVTSQIVSVIYLFEGHQCEEHNNPPDFFLDIINGDSTAVTVTADDQPNGEIS